jgi:hypothetical protein
MAPRSNARGRVTFQPRRGTLGTLLADRRRILRVVSPGPDPNWFYSSLAQSAATIVGIVGAFLVAYVLGQRTAALEERRALLQAARDADRLVATLVVKIRDHLEWYEEEIRPHLGERGVVRVQGVVGLSAWRGEEQTWIIHDGDADLFRKAEDALRGVLEALGEEAADNWLSTNALLRIRVHTALRLARIAIDTAQDEWAIRLDVVPLVFKDPEATVASALLKLTEVDKRLERLGDRRIPPPFMASVILLGVIATGSVMVPLGFLSAQREVDRVVLLSIFGAGLIALVGTLSWQLRQIADMAKVTRKDLHEPD